jgi:uncharacterized protein (TIGR02246 family)
MTEEMMLRNKRIRFAVVGAAITALVLTGCGTSAATSSDSARSGAASATQASVTDAQVRGLFDDWNQSLATLDPEKVADRYAPDAVLLPTVSNKVRTNRAEIVDYFVKFLQNKPQGTILDSHVKLLGPNAAIDTGTYRFTLADGSTVDARYTYVYERVDGQWLIVNHHSSAMPEG